MPFLVDTDWIVHSRRGRADIKAKLADLSSEGLAISVVSLAELYEGIYHSTEPDNAQSTLDRFVRGVDVLGIDEEVTRIFGRERGGLRKLHKTIGDLDLMIGATALRHNLTLLSNNRRHFAQIENLRILSV